MNPSLSVPLSKNRSPGLEMVSVIPRTMTVEHTAFLLHKSV